MSEIDRATAERVSGEVYKLLEEKYVFPDRVPGIVEESVRRLREAEGFESLDALCKKLTADLKEISGDHHMLVRYTERVVEQDADEEASDKEIEEERLEARLDGAGVHRVERLPGNIGLVEIRDFYPPRHHADVIPAAMELVAGTHALIFDLRRNRGGYPDTVAIWMGYLFEEQTHIANLEWRCFDRTDAYWSLPYVPGSPYLGRSIYVLVGPKTVSGGEMFAYVLKNRKRATLIGETTKGAAHGRIMFRAEDHVAVHVPSGYPSDPLTGTNWEGTGVEPDIEVPSEEALQHAHRLALQSVIEATSGACAPEASICDEARTALEDLS